MRFKLVSNGDKGGIRSVVLYAKDGQPSSLAGGGGRVKVTVKTRCKWTTADHQLFVKVDVVDHTRGV